MTVLSLVRELYSLDTLDTRFTTSSRTPPKATRDEVREVSVQKGDESTNLPQGASRPKWNTVEFYFYGLVFLVCVPQMYKAVVDISQRMGSSCDATEQCIDRR